MKWSLEFPDPVLEANYQARTQSTIRYPIFMIIMITGVLNMTIACIYNTINSNYTIAIASLCVILSTIFTILLIMKYKNLVNFGLLFSMLTYITISTVLVASKSQSNIATQAYCLVTCNCIVLCIQDFKFGVIQIIATQLSIFLIQLLVIGLPSPSLLITFVWLSFVMIFCIYKLQQQTRQFFLLSQKDSNLETILSQVATKPFVMFDFDAQQFKFRLLYSYNIILSEILNSSLDQNNLSSYIHSRTKDSMLQLQQIFKQSFIVRFQDKLIHISYSEFYLSQKTFMIVLNVQENDKTQIAQLQISQFLSSNIKSFIHILQGRSSRIIARLCLNNIIAYKTLMYKKRPHFETINLTKYVRYYLRIFQSAQVNITCVTKTNEQLKLTTIEPLLSLILIEIIKQFSQVSYLNCTIQQKNKTLMLRFYSAQFIRKLESIQYIQEGLQFMLSSFIQNQDGTQFIVILGYELIFQTDVS